MEDLPEPDKPVSHAVIPLQPGAGPALLAGRLHSAARPRRARWASCRCHREHGVEPERLEIDLGVAHPVGHAVAADPGRRLMEATGTNPGRRLAQAGGTNRGEADPAEVAVDMQRSAPAEEAAVVAPLRRDPPQAMPARRLEASVDRPPRSTRRQS